jgi:hypothetical protein
MFENSESTQHLFMDCAFTQEVWNNLKNVYKFSGIWVGNNLIDCYKQWLAQNLHLPNLPALICWSIWRERNYAVFEDNIPRIQKVIHSSLLVLRDYKKIPKVFVSEIGAFYAGGGRHGWLVRWSDFINRSEQWSGGCHQDQ